MEHGAAESLTVDAQSYLSLRPDGSPCLSGRTALVTGAGSGIGAATARDLARNGARVMLAGRRSEPLSSVAASIEASGGTAAWLPTDVTEAAQVAKLIETTMAEFGALDIAVNNAGYQEPRRLLHEQHDREYDRSFGTNVRAVFACMREELGIMAAAGAGVIVNVASVSGVRNPNPGLALYSAAKAAVISMTRSCALEYGGAGIRINAVAPGRVVTDMMLNSKIADMTEVARSLPVGRMGNPAEVAGLITWLASDAAAYVTGQVFATDGGFLAT